MEGGWGGEQILSFEKSGPHEKEANKGFVSKTERSALGVYPYILTSDVITSQISQM